MRLLGVLVGAFPLLGAQPVAAQPAPAPGPEHSVAFTVSDRRISEASGLAVSGRHPGIVYTHNDSGSSATIYAVGTDGRTKAAYTIAQARNRDWEGIALGRDEAGRPALFIADIGDNAGGAWPDVTVYRVPEPDRIQDQTLTATAFRLRYEDGPRNAEAILINPRTNRLYLASKQIGGGLYEAPAQLRTDRTNVLHRVGRAPMMATDGAFAPDGRSFAIRTYFAAHIYSAPGKLLRIVSLPNQEQGESIAFTADGHALLAGSEGVGQPVYEVRLPGDASDAEGGTGTTDDEDAAGGGVGAEDARSERSGGSSGTRDVVLLALLGAAGFVGYRMIRSRVT